MPNPAFDRKVIAPSASRRDILAAAIYLGTAVVLFVYVRVRLDPPVKELVADRYGIELLIGGILLIVSSILVSARYRFGHAIALAGILLIWPFLRFLEFSKSAFSSWLIFNLPDAAEYRAAFLTARLTILLVGLLSLATVLSVLRLLLESWTFREVPLRRRSWPAFAIAFIFVTGWYVTSVSPYQFPVYDIHRRPQPVLSLLHVQKRGLQFHEMSAAFYQDGKFYLNRDDHRLFEYRFSENSVAGILGQGDFQRFNLLVASVANLQGTKVTQYSPPLSS
jgi:hypothetical protein